MNHAERKSLCRSLLERRLSQRLAAAQEETRLEMRHEREARLDRIESLSSIVRRSLSLREIRATYGQ